MKSRSSVRFAVVFTFVLCVSSAQDMRDARFFKQTICEVEARISQGCLKLKSNTRGLIDCLTVCNGEKACIGASVLNNSNSCYVHTTCQNVPVCGEESLQYEYFSKNCDNRGSWNSDTQSCACNGGWVGTHCGRRPKNCEELSSHGYRFNSARVILDLTDKNLPETEVVCLIRPLPASLSSPSESSVIFMKNDGNVDNSAMTWERYLKGFESSASNFWLGLEKWNVLSKAGYNTMVVRSTFVDGSTTCKNEWCYDGIHLSEKRKNFTFTFESAVNEKTGECELYPVGDCFRSLQNVPFSSEDMENDLDESVNCAKQHGAGWWYNTCDISCRLMGLKQSYSGTKPDDFLIKLEGVDTMEIMERLRDIEMTLHAGSCQ